MPRAEEEAGRAEPGCQASPGGWSVWLRAASPRKIKYRKDFFTNICEIPSAKKIVLNF